MEIAINKVNGSEFKCLPQESTYLSAPRCIPMVWQPSIIAANRFGIGDDSRSTVR